MNYTAAHLGDYLVRGPLGDGTAMARSPLVPAAALWKPVYSAGASDLTLAPLVALGLSLILQVWLSRTVWGYEARACGSNPQAALRAGIAVGRWQGRLFLLSGGMAGLAGALEVLSVHHRFYAAFSPGYGYDGVAVAFLVNGAPGWLWLSSAILASMRASDKWLQLSLGVSPNTVHILVAFLLIVMTCQSGWKHLWAQLAGAPRVGDEVDSLGVETHP
jgi:simple sugar transport system permease protein